MMINESIPALASRIASHAFPSTLAELNTRLMRDAIILAPITRRAALAYAISAELRDLIHNANLDLIIPDADSLSDADYDSLSDFIYNSDALLDSLTDALASRYAIAA